MQKLNLDKQIRRETTLTNSVYEIYGYTNNTKDHVRKNETKSHKVNKTEKIVT